SVSLKVLPFLFEAKEKGMKTFFECTPAYLGRDPVLLKSLSQAAGINIITNTGYYGANNNKYIPESFYGSDPSEIASLWITEFNNGIEGTGVKPGFIKIAVNPSDTLSEEHRKIITAAAIAHLKTGMVIASHTGAEKPAFAQISILKEMGVDPSAFIWVHAQSGTIEGNLKAASEGAWISLDNIHKRPELIPGAPYTLDWYANRIVQMKNDGLLDKVLISHDSGWYDPSVRGGGNFSGFTDIFDAFVPLLRQKGLSEKDIEQILITNPGNAFKIMIRRGRA
ncbi:MAG: hypothetical protein WCE64_14695, partial [Bacteroidales bacterium]